MDQENVTREICLLNRIEYNQKTQIGIFAFGCLITTLEAGSLLFIDAKEFCCSSWNNRPSSYGETDMGLQRSSNRN